MSGDERDPQKLRELIELAERAAAALEQLSPAMVAARFHADGFGSGAVAEAANTLRGMQYRAAMALAGDEATAMLNELDRRRREREK
jgi:hypothetical protein